MSEKPILSTRMTKTALIRKAAELLRGQRLALIEAENALADYIPQLEAKGATLAYGHSVLRLVRAALVGDPVRRGSR